MFEQQAEGIWVALFLALVLYGLSNTISVPWRVKRFYNHIGFDDAGRSALDITPYNESLLLEEQITRHLYRGEYQGFSVEQFAAYSKQRRSFTLSRIKRKRNQKVWTVTIVSLAKPLPHFCARPTFVPEAPEYMLQSEPVLFPDDAEFSKRIHVVAPDHHTVRKVFIDEVREYLTGLEPLSLESVQHYLIHRRPREPHDTGSALRTDLDAAVMLAAVWNKTQAGSVA